MEKDSRTQHNGLDGGGEVLVYKADSLAPFARESNSGGHGDLASDFLKNIVGRGYLLINWKLGFCCCCCLLACFSKSWCFKSIHVLQNTKDTKTV